jgi:dienelactone hydrolase
MKKLLTVLAAIGMLAACGDDSTGTGETANNIGGSNVTSGNQQENNVTSNSGTTPGNNVVTDAGTPDDMQAADMSATPDMSQAPTYGDPGTTGSFATSTRMAMTTLGSDNVPLTIYSPVGAGPHPVVVFHHGFQLSASLYTSYGERLASWGYVAVFPDMPGGLIGGPTHVDLKNNVVELMNWIEAEAMAGNLDVDTTQMALAGHSLGGKISLRTATEDARVKAVIAIEPVDSAPPGTFDTTNYPSVAPELMPSITAPIAIVGETVNATCEGFFCQPCAPADENFEQYYAAATSPAYVMDVLQANHVSFLDDPNCGFTCSACGDGSDNPAVTRSLTQRVLVAFLELNLRGETQARPYLTGMPADMAAAGLATYEFKNGL